MPEAPPPSARLAMLAGGKWVAQALSTAAALELADQYADGPQDTAAVAERLDLHAPSLGRLLRALASVGVFASDAEGRYRLTPMGEHLRRDHPESMWAVVRMESLQEFWRAWGELEHCVRTGASGFRAAYGVSFFEHLRGAHDAARVFDEAMTDISEGDARMVVEAYDFTRHHLIADVGGGHGRLLAAALQAAPEARGWLCDLADVVESARPVLEASGVAGRVQTHAIDFFQGVPAGAGCVMLKHIIHDWGDDACVTILGHCREALADGGRVLVIESPLPEGDGPHTAKLLDLQMLVMTEGGRERHLTEYEALFARAGLELVAVHQTAGLAAVLEAMAA